MWYYTHIMYFHLLFMREKGLKTILHSGGAFSEGIEGSHLQVGVSVTTEDETYRESDRTQNTNQPNRRRWVFLRPRYPRLRYTQSK